MFDYVLLKFETRKTNSSLPHQYSLHINMVLDSFAHPLDAILFYASTTLERTILFSKTHS